MKTVSIDFVKILRELYIKSKSEELENLGYDQDTEIIDDSKIFLYKDVSLKSLIVLFIGLDLTKDFNVFKIPNIINEATAMVKNGELNIKKIIEKYNEYDIIFLGHSLGGHIINKNLKNTKYKCFTYNSFLVNDKPSLNIKNYRTNGDILSLGLIGKETETIDINLWDYLFKNNFNLINYFIESHYTGILNKLNIKLNIDIPVNKEN